MAFTQKVTKISTMTAEEKASYKEQLKNNLKDYKNPFASANPFKDEQELIFEGLTEVAWSHQKYGSGKYLALSFVGIEPTISLSTFLKEVEGYPNFEIKDTDKAKSFKNDGGFADWLRLQEWDENLIDNIEEYFGKLAEPNKVKVKLTKYYIPMGSSRKACSLTNLIQLNFYAFARCALNQRAFLFNSKI